MDNVTFELSGKLKLDEAGCGAQSAKIDGQDFVDAILEALDLPWVEMFRGPVANCRIRVELEPIAYVEPPPVPRVPDSELTPMLRMARACAGGFLEEYLKARESDPIFTEITPGTFKVNNP